MSGARKLFTEVLAELKDIENPRCSIDAMIAMVAAKRERRAKKGLAFNCLVFDIENLNKFLVYLKSNLSSISNETRFQVILDHGIMVPLSGANFHWMALDILIKDKQVHFFLLNSLGILVNPDFTGDISMLFHSTFGARDPVIRRSNIEQLQASHVDCAFFAFDHACRMAKIDGLHKKVAAMPSQGFDRWLPGVKFERFTPEFGPLLRNSQLYSTLSSQFYSKGLMGNDTEDLETYVEKRVRIRSLKKDQAPKKVNDAVFLKQESLKKKTLEYWEKLDEKAFNQVVKENNSFKYIRDIVESYKAKVARFFIEDGAPDKLADCLDRYIGNRSLVISQYFGFAGRLNGMSQLLKITAAKKLKATVEVEGKTTASESKSRDVALGSLKKGESYVHSKVVRFTDEELYALRDGRLGKILAEHEAELPQVFLQAENLRIVRQRPKM